MYTVCYVLTDSAELAFFNEMMISISSLRNYRYAGRVAVVTDPATAANLVPVRGDLERFSVQLITTDVPEAMNQVLRSRYLKTTLRRILIGDYLFVDTDTVFASCLPDVISDHDIAMVTDHHYDKLIPGTTAYDWEVPLYRKAGLALSVGQPFFNSGVIWARDTESVRMLYRQWHEQWTEYIGKGVTQDQPALNAVNVRLGGIISRLDDTYNVQVTGGENIPFSLLGKAKLVHYFHTGPTQRCYLLTFPEVRNLHYDSPEIRDIIASPGTAFIDGKVVTAADFAANHQLIYTRQCSVLRKLYRHRRLFMFNECVIGVLCRVFRWIRSPIQMCKRKEKA